jgi:hypothetical protein
MNCFFESKNSIDFMLKTSSKHDENEIVIKDGQTNKKPHNRTVSS